MQDDKTSFFGAVTGKEKEEGSHLKITERSPEAIHECCHIGFAHGDAFLQHTKVQFSNNSDPSTSPQERTGEHLQISTSTKHIVHCAPQDHHPDITLIHVCVQQT